MLTIKIGDLHINGYAALAPMAGVADRAFRELCMWQGAAFCVGELTSAKAVVLGDKKSASLLRVQEREHPMGVQLFGGNADIMAQAALVAAEQSPDFIDINMGCPAKKVLSSGGGAALHKKPKLAQSIVKKVVDAVGYDIPVTVKMRLGTDRQSINVVEMAQRCEAAGARAVTVHARTAEQMYSGTANLSMLKAVKKAVGIPVIANGSVTSAQTAALTYEQTECDFVMVGRAAMGNPFIFYQINAFLKDGVTIPEAPLSKKMLSLLEQAELMIKYKDPYNAMLEVRKHAAWYIRGIKGAAALRQRCFSLNTFEELKELCAEIAQIKEG